MTDHNKSELSRAMAYFELAKEKFGIDHMSNMSMDTCQISECEDTKSVKEKSIINKMCCTSSVLEQKVDKLNELLVEQNELMSNIKSEVRRSSVAVQHTVDTHAKLASELLTIFMVDKEQCEVNNNKMEADLEVDSNPLMAALNVKQDLTTMKQALTDFLCSDVFLKQIVSSLSSVVKPSLESLFPKEIPSAYLTALDNYQRSVISEISSTLDGAFRKLDTNAALFARESYKTSRSMRLTLERHLSAVQAATRVDTDLTSVIQDTIHRILDEDLSKWRHQVSSMMSHQSPPPSPVVQATTILEYTPNSPQMIPTTKSIIEQLMSNAQINQQLREGDINGSFERALCAGDLSLVVATCRLVEPALVFGPPCLLQPAVLLSLVQQLSTELMNDTQIKCRYLEEAIISLDKDFSPGHVEIVFQDVKRNIQNFIVNYPTHVMARRLRMILMVADSFLANNKSY